jgi:DNA-binding response OmpR family regulator
VFAPAVRNSILIVEDDLVFRGELEEYLQSTGFFVKSVASIEQAEAALTERFDILFLDINLPDGSGVEFCKRIRPYLAAGIVMCTGRSERELRIEGLHGGADAYLVKPVEPDEIQATLASVLRRVAAPPTSPMVSSSPMLVWTLDPIRQVLSVTGQPDMHISRRETLLLQELFQSAQQMATRDGIFKMFEQTGSPMTGPSLEVMVSRLRKKVSERTGQQLPLQSNYGEGYVFGGHSRLRTA